MVAIFTGAGTGFERGSGSVLGAAGLLGSSTLGRGGEQLFLNAATGNLLISQQDEFLVGLGPDVAISRTYNSLGDLSDENADNWRQSTQRRIVNLTGTLNAAGSTVQRVGADGATITYTWDATKSAYVSTDGAGAYDTLTSSGGVWTWRDGDSQVTETYGLEYGSTTSWRITGQADTDGNALAFTYVANSNHLDKVTTQDGSYVQYSWSGNNVTQILTGYTDLATSTAKTLTRTRYAYDGSNRLSSVTVDLSPGDNSVADGQVYTTTYTYDSTSTRVASISQSDGSRVDITYDGSNRIATLAQTTTTGVTRLTTLTYGSGYTTITDQTGQIVRMDYDAANNLTKITMPPAVSGASPQITQFAYDTNGNVTTVTDPLTNATTYTNFVNGEWQTATDRLGNVTTRTYGSKNELLTETTTSSDVASSAAAHTTRYAYDSENHLRYTLSAEGYVTQLNYNAAGQLISTVEFPEQAYGLSLYAESDFNGWVSGLSDKSSIQISENLFDARGNLTTTKSYSLASTSGTALTTDGTTFAYLTYDQAGKLLARNVQGRNIETFVYDGLGRLKSAVDVNGGTTSYVFDDANSKTIVTFTSGLVQTSTYNKAGELISFMETGATTSLAAVTGTASYGYDQLGQLRYDIDASGKKTYRLYDNVGRKVADISSAGEVAEYKYDADNRLVATLRYANTNSGTLANLDTLTAAADIATYRPASSATDLWSWNVYDKEGRLLQAIDGLGWTSTYEYNGAGRLIKSTSYFNNVASSLVTGFKTTPPTTVTLPPADAAHDAVTRTFYDKDGRLVGTLDGEGFVTKAIYDKAGQKVEEIAYANASLAADRASGTFSTILSNITADATNDRHMRYVYNGQGQLRFVVDSNYQIAETQFDNSGQATNTVRYANALSSSTTDFTYDNVKALVAAGDFASPTSDRRSWAVYDAAGRLAYAIDGEGGVTKFSYNASGQVIKATQFAVVRSTTSLPDQATMDTWATANASSTNDRVTRNYYDGAGVLRYVADGESYVTRRTEDAEGRLTLVERFPNPAIALGVTIITDATTIDTLHSWVIASGGVSANTTTAYDVDGRVSTVTDGEGNVTRSTYNINGTLQSQTVGDGTSDASTTYFVYDGAGQVLEQHRAYGTSDVSITKFTYDGLGNVLTVTDPDNHVTTQTFDRLGQQLTSSNALSGLSSFVYNAFDEVVQTTDPNNNVSFNFYDALGRLTKNCDALKYVTETSYTTFGEVASVTRRYNAATNTPSITVQPIVTPDATHDATTNFLFDRLGRLTKTTDTQGYYEQYTLNAFGNRTTVLNKLGGSITNSYDRRGLLVSEVLPMASVNNAGTVVATTVTNKFAYDARGNRTQMIEAFGLAEARTTNYAYDKIDRLITKTGDAVSTVGFSDFTSTTAVTVTTTGSVVPTESYVYDRRGNLIQVTDANGAKTLSYYDKVGRKTAEVGALGTLKAWTYDAAGNLLTERVYGDAVTVPGTPGGTPPNPINGSNYRETVYAYDVLNRLSTSSVASVLVGTWDSVNNGVSRTTVTVSSTLTYDANGNVVTATDANGGIVYSYYDKLGNKTAQLDQEGYLTTWTYDSEGNVLSERRYATKWTGSVTTSAPPAVATDATNDRVTNFTYDRNGHRLTEIRTGVVAWTVSTSNGALTAAGTNSVVTYTYNGLGQVLTKAEATGDSVTYTYDQTGRLTQETRASYADRTENALYNAQFSNTSGWMGYSSVTSMIRSGSPYVGSQSGASFLCSLILASGVGQAADMRNDDTHLVAVSAGDKLYVEAGVETTGTASGAQLVVDYLNSSGTLISSATVGSLSGTVAYNTKISGTVIVVAGATKLRLRLVTTSSASGNGSFTLIDPLVQKIAASQTNTFVTPTVNYFYNGLNNLSRTEQLGSGSLATRVTTYAYQAGGGRLASMTDPAGKTHNYDYDAAGNVVRDSYSRSKSDNTTVDEGILYRRDLLGRLVTQTIATNNAGTWTRGDSQNTQFNAYGDVAQRGVNGLWQESFTYNNRGLVEKSNSGDGVWRFFVYDKQGNQVLAIESEGNDYSSTSLSTVLTALGTYAGATYVDGVNTTISIYEKRNQAIQVRMPQRETTAAGSSLTSINSSQTYNAFGEVATQTDALNNVTTLTYNTMGRLIQKVMPQVSVTSATGVVSTVNPTETYYYDLSGRQVGTQDANGNVAKQLLLAGSGYGGADALVTTVFHADGGALKTLYDVFGDARILRNELSYDEVRTYDAMGHVATIVRRTGLKEEFTYDLLGQQTKHVLKDTLNAVLATETTDFDLQGRVTKTVDQGGDITTYAYSWSSTLTNSGMSGSTIIGGWTKTTTMWQQLGSGLWKTRSETTDVHGLTTAEADLGGNTIAYTYDRAGRLTQKQGTAGSVVTTLANTFYNTGLTATTVDSTTGMTANSITSTFKYDAMGRRTAEKYSGTVYKSLSDTSYTTLSAMTGYVLQDATIAYDALGRMTIFTNKNAAAVVDMTINQYYDAAGNIRHTATTYPNLVAGTGSLSTDKWFSYDSMNRMVIADGALVSGAITAEDVAGAKALGYDVAGNRVFADTKYMEYVTLDDGQTWRWIHQTDRESYTYDADNQLASSKWKIQNETVITRDIRGRVTAYTEYYNGVASNSRFNIVYNARGQVASERNVQVIDGATDIDATITNTYDNYGNMTYTLSANAGITDTSQSWTYGAWYDGAVFTHSTYDKDYYGSNTLWNSDQYYDGLGRLQRAFIADQKARAVHYALNADGLIVMKAQSNNSSNDPDDVHRFVGGKQVGEYTNDANEDTRNYDYETLIYDKRSNASGSGRFYHGATTGTNGGEFGTSGYDPINAITAGVGQNSRSRYTVQSGDTLQGIAASLWGDSSLWYKLAEANGLSADSALTGGQVLSIPLQGPSNRNNADMFRPYDPSSAVGDLSPTSAKPPKKNKCGVFGQILIAVIAIAVTVALTGPLSAAIGAALQGTAAAGTAAAAAASAAGGAIGGALAGAAGSIVSQGFGVATGIQQGFSWKGVALAALAGGISGGISGLGNAAQAGLKAGGTLTGFGKFAMAINNSGVAASALHGAASSALTQGIGVATGLQDKFDWAGVAAAGVGAGISAAVSKSLIGRTDATGRRLGTDGQPLSDADLVKSATIWNSSRGIGNIAASSSAALISNAATRSVINGTDFGDNILAALPDTIAQTIGGIIQNAMDGVGVFDGQEEQSATNAAQAGIGGVVEEQPTGEDGDKVGGFNYLLDPIVFDPIDLGSDLNLNGAPNGDVMVPFAAPPYLAAINGSIPLSDFLAATGAAAAGAGTAVSPQFLGTDMLPPLPGLKETIDAMWQVADTALQDAVSGNPYAARNRAKIALLHQDVRGPAAAFIDEVYDKLGIQLAIDYSYRTYEEQDRLFAKGRTAPGPRVTKARGGFSNHNFGTAIDVYPVLADGKYHPDPAHDKINIAILKRVAPIGIANGFSWGGNWINSKDYPHFEMTFGRSMTQMRALYRSSANNIYKMKF